MKFQEKISKIPKLPGVYLMKDKAQEIIYVGKAKNLRNRVKSYFLKDRRVKTKALVSKIADIEYFVTHNETEAFILECTLIKKHKPRYNVSFKDDKSYPYIQVTLKDTWPGIYMVRRPQSDESLYFGPYSSVGAARIVLRYLTRVFPIRDCSDHKFKGRTRPCLSYDIGRCTAPCVGFVTKEKYNEDVSHLVEFLRGNTTPLVKNLHQKMKELSEQRNYEEAALVRDRIFAVETMMEKQKIIHRSQKDQDVISFFAQGGEIHVLFLFIRGGFLLSKRDFHLKISQFFCHPEVEPKDLQDLVLSFLTQYYENNFIPDEVILGGQFSTKTLSEYLSQKKRHKVHVLCPKLGQKKELLNLALQNLKITFSEHKQKKERKEDVLREVQFLLHLKKYPHKMECFDISNIAGSDAVGSMVVFQDGEAAKDQYRKYKIKRVVGINDFAMMREILQRRYQNKEHLPDFIIIDGGRGHLGVGVQVLKELNLDLDIVGLAKKKLPRHPEPLGEGSNLSSQERIYLPGRKNPIMIKPNTAIEFLLAGIRDEAHRFAITYHKKVRGQSQLGSILDHIPGVGPVIKRELLKHFDSVEDIKYGTVEELSKIPGINSSLAQKILDYFEKS